jgi:hypothetical protein
MRVRHPSLAGLCILAALIALPCAGQQTYAFTLPAKDEPIYGTWVNTAYSAWSWTNAQKYVFLGWGLCEIYTSASDESASYEESYILVEKGAGAGGSTLYKLFLQGKDNRNFILAHVSADRKTLEFAHGAGFPTESDIDPASSLYRIYHRQ